MPIVGSFAGASARAYGLGAGLPIVGDFESIATTTLTTATSTITFSSIPATYTHLQIRAIARVTNAVSELDIITQFNSDTASNYSSHQLYGDGSSAASGHFLGTNMTLYYTSGASAIANNFGCAIIDILDYANTNKYKTTRSLSGTDNNGTGYALFRSGNWRSTSAITSITLTPSSGNIAQYSSFALYGVKA
jgi:hypothetical protein